MKALRFSSDIALSYLAEPDTGSRDMRDVNVVHRMAFDEHDDPGVAVREVAASIRQGEESLLRTG